MEKPLVKKYLVLIYDLRRTIKTEQINFSAKHFKVASAFYDGGCPCQVLGSICKCKITLSEYFVALTKILLNH